MLRYQLLIEISALLPLEERIQGWTREHELGVVRLFPPLSRMQLWEGALAYLTNCGC